MTLRRNTWEEFKAFAKSVADAMTRDEPDRYIATLSKANRRGKVFIDYLRNHRGATAIASYSTRRREGAPVAVPLDWDELSTRIRPDMYNIRNLPKRLDKLKQDPWADFFTMRQSITRQDRRRLRINFCPDWVRQNSVHYSCFSLPVISAHIKIAEAVPSIVGSFVE